MLKIILGIPAIIATTILIMCGFLFIANIVLSEQHMNANAATQVNEKIQNTIPNLTYFKDNHAICYAAINNLTYNGMVVKSITTVDCKKVDL